MTTEQVAGIGSANHQSEMLARVRNSVETTAQGATVNPELRTLYYPFPLSKKVVVDFRTWVFLLGRPVAFGKGVEEFMAGLGYRVKTEFFTYSPNLLLGISRKLVKVSLRRAETTIYFKDFGDLLYVSLRAAYKPFISWLRVFLFCLVCMAWPLFVYVSQGSTGGYGVDLYYEYGLDLPDFFSSAFFWVVIIPSILIGIVLGAVLSIVSLLRGNGFWGWLYARYDELYRDDIASVWNMSELAIISVADAMDLEQIPVGDEQEQSSFQRTQLPRRRPRF